MREFGGTGLGLTICRRIASAMGGSLTVQSEGLGTGATFEFVIPLLRAPRRRSSEAALVSREALPQQFMLAPPRVAAASGTPAPATSASGTTPTDASSAPVRVLIAEDDRLCQTLMRKLLPKLGFDATLVDNGGAAIDGCCELSPATGGALRVACRYVRVLFARALTWWLVRGAIDHRVSV